MVIEPIVYTGKSDEVVYNVFAEDGEITSIVAEKGDDSIILDFADLNAAIAQVFVK